MMGTMSSIKEIMQFCRLCLVKDQVNVSIFEEHGDTRDVKRKISECLPVTVSEEDSLPKKICDGCLYKLELLYQFRTTCVSAEKQLQVWIAELNNSESKEDQDLKLQHSQTSVKEEIFDATDHPDNSEYVIEEQHISYEEGDIPYNESQDDNDDGDATNSSDDEPLAKRRKRFLEEQVQTDDTLKTADNKMAITKLEHESDDENVDDPEPNFVSVGTSDDQQPGPSGLNKMSATTTNAEMPCDQSDDGSIATGYECELCVEVFPTENAFLSHYTKEDVCGLLCCVCDAIFLSMDDLVEHQQTHSMENIVVEPGEIQFEQYNENVEAVLNIPSDEVIVDPTTNDLVYILDDSSCVNEVVIEETNQQDGQKTSKSSSDNAVVVHTDHVYMMSPQQDLTNSADSKKKRNYVASKGRQPAPKRRHEVPDFSASNYVVLTPNSDVDVVHYKCLRCEQLFISKFVFLRHIEKGKCFVNNCDVCPAIFERNSEFYDHYVTAHTDRAICTFCFRTFMYEKNVKEHMLRHLDQFRHRCDVCNKGFYTLREFRNHYKNRHMGIRHRCAICGRSFADEYYFKRHIATHSKIEVSDSTSDLNSSI
ncbi:transcription factor E4F1-like isoform X4 [Onthophagus taurus]|uniref:transcription factor E4F1-like isoform X4 n=1 Tax=Onthophagus taurus TaxID=166361 RepID=UPI000C1FF09A|nr:transcription factor E4F1-like isoform X4 [Onthophagus taurus]